MPTPTPEQQSAVDAFTSGGNLLLTAGAGTGKTSCLRMIAESAPDRSGLYLAFNKAIAADAAGTFPWSVNCSTAHALAFRAVGKDYAHRLRGPRVTARQAADILDVRKGVGFPQSGRGLRPDQLTRVALDTVTRFCQSADPDLTAAHVPDVNGITGADAEELAGTVMPIAARAWADTTSTDGRLKYQHDFYLKSWQLTGPRMQRDYVMLDEAQDANPVIASIIESQEHVQRVLVGDASQSIYSWRGAIDAMSTFDADRRIALSHSFRFGPPIADEANRWLELLDADLRLTGAASHVSAVADLASPDAVLCRSNSGTVAELLDAQGKGVPVALVGGGREVRSLAEAARSLKEDGSTWHPELAAFTSWSQVQDYCDEDAGAADLKVFVDLIDRYGTGTVIRAIDGAVDESAAQLVVSTAHKSKGLEWDRVRIADDFVEPTDGDGEPVPVDREEAMLAYVSVTRARKVLDRGGLSWIDGRVGPAAHPSAPAAEADLPLAPTDAPDGTAGGGTAVLLLALADELDAGADPREVAGRLRVLHHELADADDEPFGPARGTARGTAALGL